MRTHRNPLRTPFIKIKNVAVEFERQMLLCMLNIDEDSLAHRTNRRETKMLKLYRRLNPFIVLKLDIFHWMRRLLKGITNEKHAFVPGFFREIRMAVFVLFKEDFDRLIKAIMTFRKCDAARAEQLVTKKEVCRLVRKNVPRPRILRRRLELVYENYRGVTENDVPLFNSSMHDVWDQCMVHVDNDCLSDAPAECAMYYKLKDMNTLSWTSGHCTSSFCYRLIRIPC